MNFTPPPPLLCHGGEGLSIFYYGCRIFAVSAPVDLHPELPPHVMWLAASVTYFIRNVLLNTQSDKSGALYTIKK